MEPWQSLGRMLLLCGVLLVIIGGLMLLAGKIPGIGRLPGDILIRKGNFTFYFPIVTTLLLSLILTILLNLFLRGR
ncbi:MAG: DUF2905 domain-containing protein [Bacillota bacterium]|jgi:hypothetical protein